MCKIKLVIILLAALLAITAAPPAQAASDLHRLLKLGAEALRTGDTLKAIKNYGQITANDPENHRAWYQLATAYYKEKQYRRAIRAVTKAIETAPINPGVQARYYSGRAWACYQAGLFGQAVMDMEQAVELAPNNPKMQQWLLRAQKAQRKRGDGPSLESVLDEEPGQDSQASDDEPADSDDTQASSDDDQTQDDDSGTDQDQEQDSDASQQSPEDKDPDDQDSGQDTDQQSGGQDEDASASAADLPAKARKCYYLCLAECAGISYAEPRGVCERACLKAVRCCR